MQNDQEPMQEPTENATLSSMQQLIDHLGEVWQRPHEPSAEAIKRIVQFVDSLPEQYRVAGFNAIAAHLVSGMSLHYLELMATFQEKAEQEGIDQEEQKGTFEDVLPGWFQKMMELSKQVSVQSVGELVDLSNITIGWYRPSKLDTAEEAQRGVYRLPRVYYGRLEREHLVVSQNQPGDVASSTFTQSMDSATEERPFTLWRSSVPKSVLASLKKNQAPPTAA